MLEEVPTEDQTPEAAQTPEAEKPKETKEESLGRRRLRVLLRRVPGRGLPAAAAAGSQGTAADREHALDKEFAGRPPDVAVEPADQRRLVREIGAAIIGNIDDDGYLVASVDEIAGLGPWDIADVETSARTRPGLRSDRRGRAGSAGMPAAADSPHGPWPARRPKRWCAITCRCCRNQKIPELAKRRRHRAGGGQGAHRVHQAPRSEAGIPLQPGRLAVRDSRRLHHQDRRGIQGRAERGRPAAIAHQSRLPAAARQGRRNVRTRRAPT